MDLLTLFIVTGYARQNEELLSLTQSNGIPDDVVTIITSYWQYKLIFLSKGKSPRIINYPKSKILIATKIYNEHFDTFILGQIQLSKAICNKFNIYAKITMQSSIYIGYLKQKYNLKNCHDPLGTYQNSSCSVGILIDRYDNWSLCDDTHTYKSLDHKTTQIPMDNYNLLYVSFNFIKKLLTIVYGGNCVCISLHDNEYIIPAFTLCYYGDSMEMIKYTFA